MTFDQRNQTVDKQLNIETLSIYIDTKNAGIKTTHSLTLPTLDFVGRLTELQKLESQVNNGIMISGLYGMGGIGKTELARAFASQIGQSFPDAQIELNLRGTQAQPLSVVAALQRLIRVFHPNQDLPYDVDELRAIYLSVYADKKVLLLLDNASDTTQVELLIPPPDSFTLITSRVRFVVPGFFRLNLDVLQKDDATNLLLQIEPRISSFAPALAKICGYLPLALRLSASALAVNDTLSVERYLEKLSDLDLRVGLLKGTVEATYQLLDDNLRIFWKKLAVFNTSFTLGAAAFVCEETIEDSEELLSLLYKYSMVEFSEAQQRFQLHDLLRDYAIKNIPSDDLNRTRLNHAIFFEAYLSRCGQKYLNGVSSGENVFESLTMFDRESENIRHAQGYAVNLSDIETKALELTSEFSKPLCSYILRIRLNTHERIAWLNNSIEACKELNRTKELANHYGNLGGAYFQTGSSHAAIEAYQQAISIGKDVNSARNIGAIHGNIGLAYANLGNPEQAIDEYTYALQSAIDASDQRYQAHWLSNLANEYSKLGQFEKANQCFQESTQISQDLGDLRLQATLLADQCNHHARLGNLEYGLELVGRALSLSKKIGDTWLIAFSTLSSGIVSFYNQDLDAAIRLFRDATELYSNYEDEQYQAICQWNIGCCILKQEDSVKLATPHLERWLAYAGKIEHSDFGQDSLAFNSLIANGDVNHENFLPKS